MLTAALQWGSLCQRLFQTNLQHAHVRAETTLAVTAICRHIRPTIDSRALCLKKLRTEETEAVRKAMSSLPMTEHRELLSVDRELHACLQTERPSHHPISFCTSLLQLSN